MAINKITAPIQPPASDADWSNTQDLIEALALGVEGPLRIVGSNVVRGAVFNIGGSVYIADADTAITGTFSKYVKITPSGASATASYVSSLTGVTWNSTYNGYYDGSGNLYLFDELLAYTMGVISTVYGNRNFNPSTMDRLGLGPGSNAGINGTALGVGSDAPGSASSSIGYSNTAPGAHSTSVGNGNTASNTGATSVGGTNTASGLSSSAFGHVNTASGRASAAVGYDNTASGGASVAVGYDNTASGDNSFAAGTGQNCNTAWETAINKIRYVEFPAGTTSGDIFTKLYALLGSPTGTKHTSVIGDYGSTKLNYLRCITTSVSTSIIIYYGNANDNICISSGSTTTITEGIYMLLVTK